VTHNRIRRALRPAARSARFGLEAWDALTARPLVRRVTGDDTLNVRTATRTAGGMRILEVEGASTGPAILKMTRLRHASFALQREGSALVAVREAVGTSAIRQLVPEVLQTGRAAGWSYLLQRRLPGEPATSAFADRHHGAQLLVDAAGVARDLHGLTARRQSVTSAEHETWLHRPAAVIASLVGRDARMRLEQLAQDTAAALPDHISLGWVHGDFWSENVLVDPASGLVTGVVDWDSAEASGLGVHDRLHLVLYRRKRKRRVELGDEICRVLAGRADWDAAESAAVQDAFATVQAGTAAGGERLAIVLYWLRVIAENLTRQPALARRPTWVDKNVRQVLACL
jgi:aminoglycoside phosphotransferase (APT) family kinase protein